MPISTAEAFKKRHVTREDGVEVLPRAMITVAALEAGYCLASPKIDEAVTHTEHHGQMTAEEFAEFCDSNRSSFVSAEEMAKSVVVIAPSGVITRGSLDEITNRSSSKAGALSDEEVEALFTTLDADNKGAITAEDFMRALYGEDGVFRLAERRKLDAAESQRRQKEAAERERAEKERIEEDKRKGAAAAAREEARAKAAKEAESKSKEAAKNEEKKKKASACC
ncbi:i/6 autoantigen-like protein [Novymonas esmeraldas]|uniref:I/6 autoantigen-like protein n=1 Tax=Novymonas esmeraldas TaxID=1808958 RepID=A0AAW0F0F0_9TRYP